MRKHIRRYQGQLALVVALSTSMVATLARAEEEKLQTGALAPVFTLKAINNDLVGGNAYVGLDKYTGADATEPKKAVIVSFFQTDCEPCKHEMPFLQLLFDSYKDKGLEVLSISIDKEQERIDLARVIAQQNNVKFPVLSDHFNYVVKRYLVSRLPSVFLVDGEGKVISSRIGYPEDASKELHDDVRKALGLPGSEPVPAVLTTYLATPHEWGSGAPVPGVESHTAAPPPEPTPPPTAGAAPAAASTPAAVGAPPAATDEDKSDTPGKKKGKGKRKGKAKGKRKAKQKQQAE